MKQILLLTVYEMKHFLLLMVLKNQRERKGKLYQLLYHLYQMARGYAFLSAWFLAYVEFKRCAKVISNGCECNNLLENVFPSYRPLEYTAEVNLQKCLHKTRQALQDLTTWRQGKGHLKKCTAMKEVIKAMLSRFRILISSTIS